MIRISVSSLCARLSDLFPGSSQVRLIGLDEADDRGIWEYARSNGFTIVSHDSDFANLSALFGALPKVIWLRCGNQPTSVVERLLRAHIDAITALDATADQTVLEIL